jgi:methionyl-tRNA synthetase
MYSIFSQIEPIMVYWLVAIAAIWTLPWKGYALWQAAKKNDKVWFIILLLLNTLAILEILYIFIFSKERQRVGLSKK